MQNVPYNTGKVKIGAFYQPKVSHTRYDRDSIRLQAALLAEAERKAEDNRLATSRRAEEAARRAVQRAVQRVMPADQPAVGRRPAYEMRGGRHD